MNAVMVMDSESFGELKANVANLVERVNHIDKCMDSVKRTVWMGAGAVGVMVFLLELFFKR